MPPCNWSVYGLLDPCSRELRYVGWSIHPETRLRQHIAKNHKEHGRKADWIRSLLESGQKPQIVILETGHDNRYHDAETTWIWLYRQMGVRLTNATNGGQGMLGYRMSTASRELIAASKRGKKRAPFSAEMRTKLSASLRARGGRPHSEATKRKLSLLKTGLTASEETRRKMSLARKGKGIGRTHSEETRRKLSRAWENRTVSEQTRKRMSESHKGLPKSPETIAKLKAAFAGRTVSQSARQKMGDAKRGRPQSPEHIAKRVAAVRLTWARKRASHAS